MQTLMQSRLMGLWLLLSVGTALCAPPLSQAVIIKIDFNSVFLYGPLEGEPFTRWFTYDTESHPTEQGDRPGYFATLGDNITHPVFVHASETSESTSSYGFFPFWHVGFRLQDHPTLSTFLPSPYDDLGVSFFQADESQNSVSLDAFIAPKFWQTVMPELSILLLLLSGLIGLVWISRRSLFPLFFPHRRRKKRRY